MNEYPSILEAFLSFLHQSFRRQPSYYRRPRYSPSELEVQSLSDGPSLPAQTELLMSWTVAANVARRRQHYSPMGYIKTLPSKVKAFSSKVFASPPVHSPSYSDRLSLDSSASEGSTVTLVGSGSHWVRLFGVIVNSRTGDRANRVRCKSLEAAVVYHSLIHFCYSITCIIIQRGGGLPYSHPFIGVGFQDHRLHNFPFQHTSQQVFDAPILVIHSYSQHSRNNSCTHCSFTHHIRTLGDAFNPCHVHITTLSRGWKVCEH